MKYLATFLVLFLVYVLLSGFVVQELILGAIVSLVLTLIIAKYVDYKIDALFPIRLVKFIFVYLFVFIWQLILANIDVARRVLSPKIPLNPGIIKVDTELEGDFAKLTLANSITLTPGTLSIDVEENSLYVHTVEVKGETSEEKQQNIKEPFEKILGGIFK
ncbi:Putative monovalent cation/H+ antiporter subunit E [Candidatus Izimaplasma bacterium HR1]|jgi:multicomponent Na+:H+ antiporter subunit E|uniref:Na+/H+ antiporter subunit E n=1 Tax=Candidatus Izimoplasma sp. HR1 TaxID=1541959 RepID=UPI0004F5FD6D|nr:Putative monovalent cation/H+ antiporter subunit E [Candidatus Izimaplasma bacterium HR1]